MANPTKVAARMKARGADPRAISARLAQIGGPGPQKRKAAAQIELRRRAGTISAPAPQIRRQRTAARAERNLMAIPRGGAAKRTSLESAIAAGIRHRTGKTGGRIKERAARQAKAYRRVHS